MVRPLTARQKGGMAAEVRRSNNGEVCSVSSTKRKDAQNRSVVRRRSGQRCTLGKKREAKEVECSKVRNEVNVTVRTAQARRAGGVVRASQ